MKEGSTIIEELRPSWVSCDVENDQKEEFD